MGQVTNDEARQLAYAAILGQLAEGVIVTDAVGTITFVNSAAAAIHGVARLDVKPNAYSETYHLYREDGRIYPSEELPLARAVRGETVRDARWRIRRPDGREVLAIGTAQPLRAPDGRRIGAILTLRDATAHDAAERSLLVSETALRDANQQLAAHSRNVAAAAVTPKSQAPGPAIRRLKAGLQDILSHAQALQGTRSLDDAHLCGQRMHAITSALLALVDGLVEPVSPNDASPASEPPSGQARS